MACQGFGVADVDDTLDQTKRIIELFGGLEAAFNSERHQRAAASAQIFLRQGVMRVIFETGVLDPFDPGIAAKKFGDAPAIFEMALETQGNGFDSLQQQKSIKRRERRARRPRAYAAAATDVRGVLEMIGVNQIVIGRVGLAEHREASGVFLPRKLSAIDDDTAERRTVAAHEFG